MRKKNFSLNVEMLECRLNMDGTGVSPYAEQYGTFALPPNSSISPLPGATVTTPQTVDGVTTYTTTQMWIYDTDMVGMQASEVPSSPYQYVPFDASGDVDPATLLN